MKKNYIFMTLLGLLFSANALNAQTIWTGTTTTFTKLNNADWTLEANQDRITSNVWITRANNQGIFNIATETDYSDLFSPEDTEWAIGTTANIGTLNFQNWEDTSGSTPPSLVNQDMVLHLITDDIYIDIKFTSWASGGVGGGFSYQRSTNQNLGVDEVDASITTKLIPNPSSSFIQISGLTKQENYVIYNILGAKIANGTISNNENIDIQNIPNGLYFLSFDNGNVMKFIKK